MVSCHLFPRCSSFSGRGLSHPGIPGGSGGTGDPHAGGGSGSGSETQPDLPEHRERRRTCGLGRSGILWPLPSQLQYIHLRAVSGSRLTVLRDLRRGRPGAGRDGLLLLRIQPSGHVPPSGQLSVRGGQRPGRSGGDGGSGPGGCIHPGIRRHGPIPDGPQSP